MKKNDSIELSRYIHSFLYEYAAVNTLYVLTKLL